MNNRLLYIVIALMLFSCSHEKESFQFDYTKVPTSEISLKKSEYKVQQKIEVTVIGETRGVILVVDNGFSKTAFPLDKKTAVALSSDQTTHAGIYNLILVYGDKVLDQKRITVSPKSAHKEIELQTGPRTIKANANDESMTVALPEDQWGNALPEGTRLDLVSKIENQESLTKELLIENQVAYNVVQSSTQEISELIGISINNVSSKQQRIDFVPTWIKNIELELVDHYPFANNRNFIKLKTTTMRDAYGNIVADGTYVQFHVKDAYGNRSEYNSLTIDGVAICYIKNPKSKNTFSIYAQATNGVTSNVIDLSFEDDLQKINYTLDRGTLIVGPLRGKLGEFVADGTSVKVDIGEINLAEESLRGYASFDLKSYNYKGKSITIEVAGQTIKF